MNKKLISVAVSAAVVAPITAHGEFSVYGRVALAVDQNGTSNKPGADTTVDTSGVSSRFGLKYDQALGGGLTAHARYEFATSVDKEQPGIDDVRIATAGISGDFGRIDLGNQWSAYFNTFGTLISPTYTLGYYLYSAAGQAPYRSSNTIKYANSFGKVYTELDVRFNAKNSPETSAQAEKLRGPGYGIGISLPVNRNLSVGAAVDFEKERGEDRNGQATLEFTDGDGFADNGILILPDTTVKAKGPFDKNHFRYGIGGKYNIPNSGYWAAAGWQSIQSEAKNVLVTGLSLDDVNSFKDGVVTIKEDVESYFIYGGGQVDSHTNWLVGYAEAYDGYNAQDLRFDGGAAADAANTTRVREADVSDSEHLVWGLYRNLGGGLNLFYEGVKLDSDSNSWSGERHLFGMRVVF